MEIRVEERMTGRELHDRIIVKYGSREALEQTAQEEEDVEARDDLWTLERLEEDPARLDTVWRQETITRLEPGEVERLTGKRLAVVETLASSNDPLNVSSLAARLGRDKKNVSEDLELLEDLGLIHRERRGREKLAWPRANEIHIVLDTGGP